MARTVNTQIVATNKPVGQFQFELQKVNKQTFSGNEIPCFYAYYYSIEDAKKAEKNLRKKLGLK